jgi:hypothetical protein
VAAGAAGIGVPYISRCVRQRSRRTRNMARSVAFAAELDDGAATKEQLRLKKEKEERVIANKKSREKVVPPPTMPRARRGAASSGGPPPKRAIPAAGPRTSDKLCPWNYNQSVSASLTRQQIYLVAQGCLRD